MEFVLSALWTVVLAAGEVLIVLLSPETSSDLWYLADPQSPRRAGTSNRQHSGSHVQVVFTAHLGQHTHGSPIPFLAVKLGNGVRQL